MAASSGKTFLLQVSFSFIVYCMLTNAASLQLFQQNDILSACELFCVVLFPETALTNENSLLQSKLTDVSFRNETAVLFGKLTSIPVTWPNGKQLLFEGDPSTEELENSILIFKRLRNDRSCLLMPDNNFRAPKAVYHPLWEGEEPTQTGLLNRLTEFINVHCDTFQNTDGSLTIAGIHRKDILENLHTTKPVTPSSATLGKCEVPVQKESTTNMCLKSELNTEDDLPTLSSRDKYFLGETHSTDSCERIATPTPTQFFHEYLSRSKPVIITGATEKWDAFTKWTNKFLREKYGDKKVHIKITPDGQYEGVEPISLWENHNDFDIPQSVHEKLPFPDLVVVRPASMEIRFSEFLDLVENISAGRTRNISAYLEYSSIADYFPKLRRDIDEMPFFRHFLRLKHLNIWLSDGNTLGKLHFDPFDNFLCQISGEKQVLMYEPHDNTRLYEGHIQEAVLSYNSTERKFYRRKLLESTSMVMSPVDPVKPDLQRFPKFADVRPLNCTIKAGEVLFMPSFWWHEVLSKPNTTENRNLAVNFWYEPFLTREFPCPECHLDVNPEYFHLL